MDEQRPAEPRKGPSHVLATISITLTGDDQAPLVATRILVDGKEAELPLVLLLGGGEQPLTVAKGMGEREARRQYAKMLHGLSQGLYQSVIDELEAKSQPQASVPPHLPPADPPVSPSIDSEEN